MNSPPELSRESSYTTPRPDVFSMVPATAMTILDLGRSNGALGASLRFAREGGVVVVSLPNIRHISALVSIFFKGSFPRRDRGIFDKTHLRWFTIADARSFVGDAGLKVEAVSYSLRLGDKGGGLLNKIMTRLFAPFESFFPIREFFAYQFCLRAAIA